MEEAVVVNIPLSDSDLGSIDDDAIVEAVDAAIRTRLADSPAGAWDGHKFGGGWARIFCYGDSADVLFDTLAEILLGSDLPFGTVVVKRYGPPGSRENLLPLSGGSA
jgi:hypothetical protein